MNPRYVIGQRGYIFAVNKNAISVMNPSIEGQDLTNLKTEDGVMLGQELVQTGTNGGGSFSYMWPNPITKAVESKITYVEAEPNWGWIVAAGAYLSEFNQGANQVLYLLLITLGIALIIGAAVVWLFTNHIMKPISLMVEQVEKVSHGDLTIESISVKIKDEIGQLANDFNTMTSNLKKLIRQVALCSEQVAASSEELTASAEQSNQAAENNAAIIQELAEESSQSAKKIGEYVVTIQ
ncbi:methyl-accepting chemotaxis protein [Effusibacillus dendaii]|uniref:HAMP domain-containing protein n=1 Tax=Effusibacillus dendaii TaxID=2743772 RepID=A0A7I8DEJ8_9BACL|nr:hypothetical protein skT53_35580 [Effusibacillus dendaii]